MRIVPTAAVFAVTLAVSLVDGAPALAATESKRSAFTSGDKQVSVKCGPGRVVIGSGGFVSGDGHVALTAVGPLLDDTRSAAVAEEVGAGTSATWAVTSTAVCEKAPAGYEIVAQVSPAGSLNQRRQRVYCPPSKRVLGVSGGIIGGDGEVGLDGLDIMNDLSHVTVSASEDQNGYAGSWRLVARAVCADPLPGQHLVSSGGTQTGSASRATRTATCPPGERMFGTGGEIADGAHQVWLEASYAENGEATVTAFEDADGFGGPWRLAAYAVCADG
ncbi:hypothetical protein Val02_21290 [Virgisporangium aliadipatigenens]|uniref:Secreted protein n=1 Tax=Virgisporangium aliadipatigenens TaxID=741659 RepID=A0A8J3YJF6_9ACTN|nr:hypothetical protein [Virgisporangium aliadipatigenens]GIJ45243.1 hypothetical protein Val02_21290 [Virgisporangium aliadipatigenens]